MSCQSDVTADDIVNEVNCLHASDTKLHRLSVDFREKRGRDENGKVSLDVGCRDSWGLVVV